MPFMSEAVTYAIWKDEMYRQTGIDDLESVVWVLLWFFCHYIPRGVGKGWTPFQYQEDIASRPSMSAEPATPRTKLLPSMPLHGPAARSTSRKRSLVDSGSSRKRARLGLPSDPLMLLISSYDSAQSKKSSLKASWSIPELPPGWNTTVVDRLFAEIWSLDGWEVLLPRISRFHVNSKRLPAETTEEDRLWHFSKLVQDLKRIFQHAAQHATMYYQDTQPPTQSPADTSQSH